MSRALITGITGFVGSHLAEYLIEHTDWEIVGMCRWRSPLDNLENLSDRINRKDRVRLVYGDLRDAISIQEVVSQADPDYVFHLAAQSFPKTSFDSPLDTLDTNIQGTVRLLDALRHERPDAIIHVCSSSEVFGRVPKDKVPINEECSFHPASPYAISKVGTDLVGRFYAEAYAINVQTTRMFTHSVSRWTPIIFRDSISGLMDIKYISEFRQAGKRGGYFSGKFLDDGTQIWDFTRSSLEIWNCDGWTPIKHLSCHPIGGHKLLEISTRSGFVDVTDNHSIISSDGASVEAWKLSKGDKLKTTFLPYADATDISDELAWFYGFFVAEGCVTNGKIRVDNKKIELIKRSKNALLRYMGADSYEVFSDDGMIRLIVRKPDKFTHHFVDCYAKDRNKRIPKLILNASLHVKMAFLRGYNAGDGRTTHPKLRSEFIDFKTKSPILAMGLYVLVQEVLRVECRVYIEHRGEARYFAVRPLNQTKSKRGQHRIKPSNEVVSILEQPYEGEVWDFETGDHQFHAGVGNLIVHNTGPRRGDVFAESSFAKQIAMIEAGLLPPAVKVGNLNSLRTVADVRDAVRAYHMLLTVNPVPGAYYNIGGEKTLTVGEILEFLLSLSPKKNEISVELDSDRVRPIDADLQIPDTRKFFNHTGWKTEISFEKTMQDLMDYWRHKVAIEGKRLLQR